MKRQKVARLTFILLALLIYISCRKIDYQQEKKQTTLTSIEEKFFNSNRTADPIEKALVAFLKRQNDKLHFVEKAANQIGLPRWDKAIVKVKSKINGKLAKNASDSTTFFIPFVRDSENYVNAAMVIKTSVSDTSFSYLCDWQYQSKAHGAPTVDTSAERYALFFMLLDNQTFGHLDFRLTDASLFPQAAPRNNRNRRLQILNVSSPSLARASLFQYHEVCLDFYVCGDPDWCADHGGCDYLHCAAAVGEPGHCYVVQSFCDGWWEDSGSGGSSGTGTGGSGGTGSGGGGGGSAGGGGGDGTPPNCPGRPAARIALMQGCPPGWQPGGGGGGALQPPDPCLTAQNAAKKMDTIFMRSKADSVLASIPNLATEPKEKGFPIIKRLSLNPYNLTDTTTVYRCGAIQTGTDSSMNYSIILRNLEFLAADLHTHPPIGYAANSAKDIYDFLQRRIGDEAHLVGFFVAAFNSSQYAVTVTDPDQATAFSATKDQFLSGTKWKEDSEIGKAFEKATTYFEEKFSSDPNRRNLAYEMAMSAVLNQFNTGFTLNKKDAAGNFKPIVVKTTRDPRKPKKTIYTQDCL